MSLFCPKEFQESFYKLDFNSYYNKGFRTILLDIDNTLAPYNDLNLSDNHKNIIKSIKNIGFNIILLSNGPIEKTSKLANELNLNIIPRAYKPFSFNYFKALKTYNLKKNEILCIGDQIITDVLGANIMNLYSIYVTPLTKTDKYVTYPSRIFEKFMFKFVFKRDNSIKGNYYAE